MTDCRTASAASTAELLDLVQIVLAGRLGADRAGLDPGARFSELGLDSLGTTALTQELSRLLDRPLPITAAWDHPTAERLAAHLAGETPAEEPAAPALPVGANEPIAVVGMACRFPGSPDLDAYWKLLSEGRDAVTTVPADRWPADACYDPDPARPGRTNSRWGGFIEGVDLFDPAFFGISPREAAQLDPQQRLMLELAWSAVEHSGTEPLTLRGSRTGVFSAALWSDYARLPGRSLTAIEQHTATGQDLSIIPARISYTLGLRGPSIGVTTACSGALVAVHLACQSLRTGECDRALAGGINLILAPESTVAMGKFGGLSPNGRSRAFDADADGYVRAEGGGLVVLKTLTRALADGDEVLAVIRGSAVNNDGYSNGLTAPNPQAQEDMLRDACARAGVAPGQIQYVEAHGTGTALGDPIEAQALGRVLGRAERPLLVGSVKSAVGHLEAAAGIAGLIKTVLALRHGVIPANLHFEHPNPQIDFAGLGLRVVTEPTEWPEGDGAPLAGVSSFGFGGTNCHVVLEGRPRPAHLLRLAADEPARLAARAGEFAAAVRAADASDGPGRLLAGTSPGSGRHRAAAVVRTRGELLAALDRIADGRADGTRAPADPRPRTVFVFSGQGAQWTGMARDLIHREPVFAAAVDACDTAFQELSGWSVRDELLHGPAERTDRTEILQPLLFTVQLGLTALWRDRGVEPDAVIGHSLGEIAAACAAGALSLADAARVVHHRSLLMARIDGTGAVAVVGLPWAEAVAAAAEWDGQVEAVGENGPRSTVLAGGAGALDACVGALAERGIATRRVPMAVPVHTSRCEPLAAELDASLAGLTPRPARCRFYSAFGAEAVDGTALDSAYWSANLRRPVRFASAVRRLLDDGPAVFVEVSAHPVLTSALAETIHEHTPGAPSPLASLHRGRPADTTLLTTLAALYEADCTDATGPDPGPEGLLLLSAHSAPALSAQAGELADLVDGDPLAALDTLGARAAAVRARHKYRAAVPYGDRADAVRQLRRIAADGPPATAGRPAGIAFVFSGQGTQWAGMGAELLRREPVFAQAMERYDAIVRELAGWSVITEITRPGGAGTEPASRLDSTALAQPVLCALQLALTDLWRSWGVEPALVTGHSVGEIAAAAVAGALTPRQALACAVARGRSMDRPGATGRMVSLTLPEGEVLPLLGGLTDRLAVAAVNGPAGTVVSGAADAVATFLGRLGPGVAVRPLAVDYAFHSPLMAEAARELAAELHDLDPTSGRLPLVSTVTGDLLAGTRLTGDHWGRTVREPVRFADAVAKLAELGATCYLEIGPHPALGGPLAECLAGTDVAPLILPTLRRGDDTRTPLASLGALWQTGLSVRYRPRHRPDTGTTLPEYPWQRERHWLTDVQPPLGESAAHLPVPAARHHTVVWERRPAVPAPVPDASGHWLLIGEGELTDAVANLLRASGGTVNSVSGAGAEIVPLLDGPAPLRGVVVLTAAENLEAYGDGGAGDVAGGPAGETPEPYDALGTAVEAALLPALAAVRGLGTRVGGAVPLWLVSRAVWVLDGDSGPKELRRALAGAALWGLGRSAVHEHPELPGGLIDLDDCQAASADEAALLVRELLRGTARQLAFRESVGHVPRLTPVAPERHDHGGRLSADAGYLVTGGLGGIGLRVARRLVERGARRLYLVGRHAPDADASAVLEELRAAGAHVTTLTADVSNGPEVEQALARLAADGRTLRGVVHAAGVLDDGIALRLTPERLRAVLAGKALGAHHLHRLTAGLPLDFFVLFSSYSATLGAAGQTAYAAANAVLDSLAGHRRVLGLPATSIGWGPWQGVGMAGPAGGGHLRWDERGLHPASTEDCLAAFDRLATGPRAHEVFLSYTLDTYLAGAPRAGDLLRRPDGTPAAQGPPRPAARDALRPADALAAAHPADRPRMVRAHVAATVAEALGYPSPDRIDPTAGLSDLGMDSVMAVTLARRLRQDLGDDIPLAATAAFEHPTVAALAAHLLDLLRPDGEPGPDESGPDEFEPDEFEPDQLEALLTEIEHLSDEEAVLRVAELTQRLEQERSEQA